MLVIDQKFLRTSVHLSEVHFNELDRLCRSKGMTRSSMIRDALNVYFEREAQPKVNFARIAMTSEFAQIGVDILIRQLPPSKRDDLIATLAERMELYHSEQ
jgi:metal-responsive CopG/Arc/MetJ family transcriptional regulator